MALLLTRVAGASILFFERTAAHGLNRSAMQTLYCHECVLPFTLKACCQSDCEQTVFQKNEQLLIRLNLHSTALHKCDRVTFFNDKKHLTSLGAVETSTASIVRRYVYCDRPRHAKRCIQVGLVVPDSASFTVREWRPFKQAAPAELAVSVPKDYHLPRFCWGIVAFSLTWLLAQLLQHFCGKR